MQIRKYFLIVGIIPFLLSCDGSNPVDKDPTPFSLDAPFYYGDFEIPADNPLTVEGVDLGRRLFYERQLSQFDSISCGSCHRQENAFTDAIPLAVGVPDIPLEVNTMSLANMLWNNKFFWNGRVNSLEELIIFPMEDHREMNQPLSVSISKLEADPLYPPLFEAAFGDDEITGDRIFKSMSQFMRSMISADSKYDQYVRGEYSPTEQELRGIDLFFTHPVAETGLRGGNCGDCHSTFLTAGFNTGFDGFHNNGLDTDQDLKEGLFNVTGLPQDRGKFKAPTLRNIALTAPYMHDGRFNTLEEVLDHYNDNIKESETLDVLIREASNEVIVPGEPIKLHLTEQEKQDILAFLHMLTDENFINDEAFSDPFDE